MAGIYIHVPFCRSRCSYCDFYKTTNIAIKSDFIESLKKEIFLKRTFLNGAVVRSLYFGGGTPSVLSVEEFADIVSELKLNFDLSNLDEFTVELNPDDVSLEFLKGLSALGINRVSYGVQSFHDRYLKMVCRRHDAKQALEAIRLTQSVGIDNISIDLIYGLPGLSLAEWQRDIDLFLSLKVPHLSAYHLIFEEGTLMTDQLKRGLFSEATEDESKEQFLALRNTLLNHGFLHYEISNFSLPDKSSKHNSSYWSGEPYLGLGPSAHSFDGKKRYWNLSDVEGYIQLLQSGEGAIIESEELSEKDIYNELVMLGLRTQRGISQADLFEKVSLFYQNYFLKVIKPRIDSGEICFNGTHYFIADDLFLISDKIISDLFYVE